MTTTTTNTAPDPGIRPAPPRTPLRRRRWAQVAAAALAAVALAAAAAAGGAALDRPHATVIRPAGNTAPARPKATPKVTPGQALAPAAAPAPAPGPAVPAGYAQAILNAGITAPVAWINQAGQTLVTDWQAGDSQAWTDANVLGAGGVYSYHYAIFDQITEQYFGVYPPSGGSAPASPVPTLDGSVEPSTIAFSADGGNIASNLTWSEWDGTQAVGTGTVGYESCVPNCAQGSDTPYPAQIVLSDPVNGQYTQVTETIQAGPDAGTTTSPITSTWPYAS